MKKRKKTIIVSRNNSVLFDGRLIELPVKDSFITQRSIELFDDDDPCIIHKSYVLKDYSDKIITLFKDNNTNILKGAEFLDEFSVIDFTDIEELLFELKE